MNATAWRLLPLFLAGLEAVPGSPLPLAALACVLALAGQPRRQPGAWSRGWTALRPFAVPAIAYFGLIALQIVTGRAEPRLAEQIAIAAIAIASACTTAPLRMNVPAVLGGAAIGALLAAVVAIVQVAWLGVTRAYGWLGTSEHGSGAIKFGDLASLLGLLAVVLAIHGRSRVERLLGLAGASAGTLTLALSGSRGPVLGIGVALAAWLVVGIGRWLRRSRTTTGHAMAAGTPAAAVSTVAAASTTGTPAPPTASDARVPDASRRRLRHAIVAGLLGIALLGALSLRLGQRFEDIGGQYERAGRGDLTTEVGQRMLLWHAALRSVADHPIAGSGVDRFDEDLRRQQAAGLIPADAPLLYRHVHSEYLCALATLGIPGAVGLLLMLWWPIGRLLRIALQPRAPPPGPAQWAALAVAGSFAGFAITDCLFDRQITLLALMFLGSWFLRAAQAEADSAARAVPAATAACGADVPRLSVAVITKNEAHRIGRCLQSVAFADECVVVDCGSTDDTVAIATAHGARVIRTGDWPGFGVQKNRALDACRGVWVLSIDADEVVSAELRDAIVRHVGGGAGTHGDDAGQGDEARHGDEAGYVHRTSRFCGQPLYHGLWRDDYVLRLFRRGRARFSDDPVHERVLSDAPVTLLDGTLYHDSIDSLDDAVEKTFRYAALGAQRLRQRGRGGVWQARLHATWTFVRGYLLNFGFLDGAPGWTIALLSARGTYWRYLWAAQPESPAVPPVAGPAGPFADRSPSARAPGADPGLPP